MHTYTLHNKCTHIHMHTTIHKGEKSDLRKENLACRDLGEDLYSPQYRRSRRRNEWSEFMWSVCIVSA